MPRVQIQPQCGSPEAWMALVQEEDCTFEVLELSMMPNRDAAYDRAVQWYRNSGRVTSLHGAFIDNNPVSSEQLIREASAMRCRESCRLARTLGARNVVFHGSCFPFLRGAYLEQWADRSAEFYQSLAREYGLKIYMENSMDLDPTPLRELMARVDHDLVQVCLDFGHANLTRAPLEEWFDQLGANIGYLHLSDNQGDFDYHCAMGDGTVDWALASRLAAQLPQPCHLTMEVGGVAEIRRSLEFMRRNHYFGF